ncbi:MAG TPA: NUDIX domain-containing protein [bacterium]|nr:NUDIX domain-containing protein [bacterium]
MDKKVVRVGFGVMILRDSKVLLGKRHEDPAKADSELHGEGTWTMPGGKMEFGETFETSACREVEEETGLALDEKSIKLISITNDRVPDAHFVTIGFLCKEAVGEPRVMEPDEITEWRWFDLGSVPANIFPPSKKVLEHFERKEIYYSES